MAENLEFNKNEDYNKTLVSNLKQRLAKVAEGGGKKNAAKQHEKGKLLARERINYLLDKDQPQIEIGAFAAEGMYAEQGGCPSAGVVVVIGYVSGRQCIVVANERVLVNNDKPYSTAAHADTFACAYILYTHTTICKIDW